LRRRLGVLESSCRLPIGVADSKRLAPLGFQDISITPLIFAGHIRPRTRAEDRSYGSRKELRLPWRRPVSPRRPGALNRYFGAGGVVVEGVVVLPPADGAIS
jgi:hypothetical protein